MPRDFLEGGDGVRGRDRFEELETISSSLSELSSSLDSSSLLDDLSIAAGFRGRLEVGVEERGELYITVGLGKLVLYSGEGEASVRPSLKASRRRLLGTTDTLEELIPKRVEAPKGTKDIAETTK